jgi:ABC-type phosphate transport system substrate-binding protein
VIDKVCSQKTDFAVTDLTDNLSNCNSNIMGLEYQKVAYDGLVVFVAFSYSKRERGLPKALNGQITLEQLRQLYTGKIDNWKKLDGPDLPVKLYTPSETDALRIFEQRVLKDEVAIKTFQSLQRKGISKEPKIERVSTLKMLRNVIQDFEQHEVGAIAFATISKVFGQCSVYPLALVEGKKEPVQVLVQDNGEPINPTIDLCKDKGSYFPDPQVLQTGRYPLGYPLVVVYPRDNSRPLFGAKFAEMLRTEEGQRLLDKTGVVPLQPLPRP